MGLTRKRKELRKPRRSPRCFPRPAQTPLAPSVLAAADRGRGEAGGVGAVTGAVAKRLDSLRAKGAMRNVEVADLLGTRPETVSRWNQGRAYPHAGTEKALLELEYIVDQLADLYEPDEARQWIFAPQRLLGGASPADLIRDGRVGEVMRLVGQLRDAVHL